MNTGAMGNSDDYLTLPPMDVPIDGVPAHLEHTLRQWIMNTLDAIGGGLFPEAVAVRLHLTPIPDVYKQPSHRLALIYAARDELFRVINAILALADAYTVRDEVDTLNTLLRLGASAYEVEELNDRWRVVRRLDEPLKSAVKKTVAEANKTAGEHLERAWQAAFGLAPDANVAYAEAVKAVEATSIPLIVPSTANQPTLGHVLSTLRGDLTATTPKWQVLIPDQTGQPASVSAVVSMVEALWHGHRSRHSGSAARRPNTQHEAEAAVFLAVTLVYWFTKGIICARP